MSGSSVESGKCRITKSGKEGLVHVKPNWVCYLWLIEVRLLLPHKCWETGDPSLGVGWNVNSFDSLEFSQAHTSVEARVMLGMWP